MKFDSRDPEFFLPPGTEARERRVGGRSGRGTASSGNRRASPWRDRLASLGRAAGRRGLKILVAAAYAGCLGWLFAAVPMDEVDFAAAFVVPDAPAWRAPDAQHPLGTTGTGTDLWSMSRAALARSALLALVGASLAAALAALVLVALHRWPTGLSGLAKISRGLGWAPLALFAVAAAVGGSAPLLYAAVVAALAFLTLGDLASRIEAERCRPDLFAARCLGVPPWRIELGLHVRHLPGGIVDTVAALAPRLMLLEIALAFCGLAPGDGPSLGTILAQGRETMIEAPWIAVYPGLLGAAVVGTLSILGTAFAPRDTRAKLLL